MNEEELNKIVELAVEKILVRMPEVVGNLMKHHAKMLQLNQKFYTDNPDFQKHKKVVVDVLEDLEGKNPHIKYEQLLEKATPAIKDRIGVMSNLDMNNVKDKGALDLGFSGDSMKASNGEL